MSIPRFDRCLNDGDSPCVELSESQETMPRYLPLPLRPYPLSQATATSTVHTPTRPLKRFWIGVMGEALMTLGVAGIAAYSPVVENPPHLAIALSLFLFFLGLLVLSISLSPARRQAEKSPGQGMLEYALIIALVAVVVIASLVLLGPTIAHIFMEISNNL
jgi:pilus assembly protein Flp/PilA